MLLARVEDETRHEGRARGGDLNDTGSGVAKEVAVVVVVDDREDTHVPPHLLETRVRSHPVQLITTDMYERVRGQQWRGGRKGYSPVEGNCDPPERPP
jgi:hypothetical protein